MTDSISTSEFIPLSTVSEEVGVPIDLLMVWYKRKRWGLLRPIVRDGVACVDADDYRVWRRHLRAIILPSLRPAERARCEAGGLMVKVSGAREPV